MVDPTNPDLESVRRAAQAERARRASRPRTIADVAQPPSRSGEGTADADTQPNAPLITHLLLGKNALVVVAFVAGVLIGAITLGSHEQGKIKTLTREKNAAERRIVELQSSNEQAEAEFVRQRQDIARDRDALATERQRIDDEKSELARLQSELAARRDGLIRRTAPDSELTPLPAQSDALADSLGFRVVDLTDDLRARWGIEGVVRGVLVIQSDPRSVGYRAGFRPGTVILQIGPMPVQTVAQFGRAVGTFVQRGLRVSILIKLGPNRPEWRTFVF